jgi:hypothetical protein
LLTAIRGASPTTNRISRAVTDKKNGGIDLDHF